jgi:signal transduction histidine kinase
VIATSLTRHRTLTLPEASRSPDAESLQSALNLRSTGSSLLVPLVSGGELQGGILLLSPYTQRRWQAGDRQILEVIASHLADRFRSINRASALTIPETLSENEALVSAQEYIASLEQENLRLTAQMRAPQSESEPAQSDKIAALLELNESAQETIQNLEAEIERLKAAVAGSPTVSPSQEIAQLTNKFQLVLRELSDARAQLATYEARGERHDEAINKSVLDMTLITSIARDLRQQISSILGYTDLLLGESVGLLGTMQRKFIERVRFGVESMGTLLEKLAEITTTDVDIQSLSPKAVDLLECIEQAVTHTSPMIREKRLALRMDFPEQMPKIVGDEDAIIQILIHLLTNAAGASPEGEEITIATRVQHAEGADYLMLTITDAGEGIPTKDLGRVFKRVYQGDEARIQGVGDSGVGLSIVKALSEALGGRVWFDSEVGVGSTFTVLLPLTDQSPLGEVYAV